MKVLDIISMGVRNLLKRKARTILTILGVLVGTAAIIVMMSLGVGMNEANMKAIEQFGDADIINVSSWFYRPANEESGEGEINSEGQLDDAAIETIRGFPGVAAATPIMRSNTGYSIVTGKYKANWGDVIGVDPSTMDTFFNVQEGRTLAADDKNVAVFGYRMPYNFYNTRSNNRDDRYSAMDDMSVPPPVNLFEDQFVMTSDYSYGERRPPGQDQGSQQQQKPTLHKFTGIGWLEGDDMTWSEYDQSIIVNIEWLKEIEAADKRRQRNNGGGGVSGGGAMVVYSSRGGVSTRAVGAAETTYQNALVKLSDRAMYEEVVENINGLGLGANGALDTLQYMEETTNQLQTLLGAIALVSLLVAAIGIANTMVMSVYERTREIAVMKVLGCKLGNIGMLFLFEAGLIGLFGGIVGIGFSALASYLLNTYGGDLMNAFGGRGWFSGADGVEMPPISIIPLWLIGLGLAFSTVIGLVSGFLPARRAMKLSVLKAIHNE